MAQINQELLARLEKKLNVKKARLYVLIQEIANEKALDRHLAALILAGQNQISIQKYSTVEDRAQIRGVRSAAEGSFSERPLQTASNKIKPKTTKQGKIKKTQDNSVFVVHGRNEALRKSMFDFLRALGLKPMEWNNAILAAKGANPHVDDIIDAAMSRVQAVVVLFTPDDDAKLNDSLCPRHEKATEGKLQGQPRPNVIFEAGLALGRHPEKTLLVQVGKIRDISDIAGKHIVRLSNDAAKRTDVANRLEKIGCKVDRTGADWTSAGDFSI